MGACRACSLGLHLWRSVQVLLDFTSFTSFTSFTRFTRFTSFTSFTRFTRFTSFTSFTRFYCDTREAAVRLLADKLQ